MTSEALELLFTVTTSIHTASGKKAAPDTISERPSYWDASCCCVNPHNTSIPRRWTPEVCLSQEPSVTTQNRLVDSSTITIWYNSVVKEHSTCERAHTSLLTFGSDCCRGQGLLN